MDLILIGGMSGSGKNVALAALEDSGYYAVNNLPLPLLVSTAEYLAVMGRDRVAVALDVKTGPGLPGLAGAIEELQHAGWQVRFLFLDSKVETLVKRFSETRRRHPFSSDERTLTEAIEYERRLLADVRPLGIAFDTSELPAVALRGWIRDFVSVDPSKLTLLIESFGYKHGVPLEADLVLDVRFMKNPHYIESLRPKSGLTPEVREYVLGQPIAASFLARLRELLDLLIPAYIEEGKTRLTIAIGCTGGWHRSIVVAEELAAWLRERDVGHVSVFHRELER